MTYAIVETGGKQMRVEPGRFYDIELLAVDEGEDYTLDRVLLLSHEDEVTVGQPLVPSATVEGTILSHRRDRKVLVYKMRPKKKTRKKRGHRQTLTRFLVRSINLEGQAIAEADADEIEMLLAGLSQRPLPAAIEAEPEAEEMLEAELGDEAALSVEEPVAEAAEPEAEEPVAEAAEPVAEEPVAEVEESEAEEPVAEAAEPEAEEPVAEVEEPEAEEPVAEAEEPVAEAAESEAEVEEPEAEEPVAEAEEPEGPTDDEDDEPVAQDESE